MLGIGYFEGWGGKPGPKRHGEGKGRWEELRPYPYKRKRHKRTKDSTSNRYSPEIKGDLNLEQDELDRGMRRALTK